jgi:hypothetical protein
MTIQNPELPSTTPVITNTTIGISWAIEGDTPTSVQLWCEPQSDLPNPISAAISDTTHTFKKLSAGTDYNISVMCLYDPSTITSATSVVLRTTGNSAGSGKGSGSGSGGAANAPPTIEEFAASAVAWNQVSVEYQIEGPAAGYTAFLNRGVLGSRGDPITLTRGSIASGSPAGFSDSPLLPFTQYEYELVVIDGPGPDAYVSAGMEVTTPPKPLQMGHGGRLLIHSNITVDSAKEGWVTDQTGRFQVYVPNDQARILHFLRDNADAGGTVQDPAVLPWDYPEALPPLPKLTPPAPHGAIINLRTASTVAATQEPILAETTPSIVDVTMIQSSFGGNLEVVARARPANGSGPDFLVTYWYEMSTATWNGPSELLVGGERVTGVTGAPCLIQGNYGDPGNFELLVPQGPVISHFSRTNSDPKLPWNKVRELPPASAADETAQVRIPPAPAASGQPPLNPGVGEREGIAVRPVAGSRLVDTAPRPQILGLAATQTAALLTWGSFGAQLITVAVRLPASGSTPSSETMVVYATAGETGWYAPVEILPGGAPINFISGRHALVQTQASSPTAQADLLVPQNGRLYHYRCDDVSKWSAWRQLRSPAPLSKAFNTPSSPAGTGNERSRQLLIPGSGSSYVLAEPTYTGVSFIEIDDGTDGFFAIATVKDQPSDTTSRVVMAVLNPSKGGWGKPVALTLGGAPVTTSAG